ncbi:MAG: hypothetical protein U0325_34070 [Polyangiales bacterium]
MLTINGANCALEQRPAPSGRSFDATCVVQGSCPEVFRLQGTTDDTHFERQPQPVSNCQAFVTNCQPQSWVVRGTLQ